MSTQSYDELLQVQDTVAGHIQAIDFLHGHEVITERKGDLNQRIQTALSKLGLSIVVVTPTMQLIRSVGNRHVFRVRLVIDISELAITNRSKGGAPHALQAALAIIAGIAGKPNGLDASAAQRGENFEINLDGENALVLVPDKAQLIYHVNAYTHVFITIPA